MSVADSHDLSTDDGCAVDEELELLRSIYVHELVVTNDDSGRPKTVSIDLHPATADKTEKQFVRLTLILTLPNCYPRSRPEITLKNSRGLGDGELKTIYDELQRTAQQNEGSQMLYQLIELAKEHLTASNLPTGLCAICLYGFQQSDVFTKTECYHHFHAHCLHRYVESLKGENEQQSEKVAACPVCREEFTYDRSALELAPPPVECEVAADFEVTPELKKRQKEMAELLQRQLARGGIIDVEAERNKYFLEISQSPAQNSSLSEVCPQNTATNKKTSSLDCDGQQQLTKRNVLPVKKNVISSNKTKKDLSRVVETRDEEETNHPNTFRDRERNFGQRNQRKASGFGPKSRQSDRSYPKDKMDSYSTGKSEQGAFFTEKSKQSTSRGRGWGRGGGISWQQPHRRGKNAPNSTVAGSTDNTKLMESTMRDDTDESQIDSSRKYSQPPQQLWTYGPPPTSFVMNPAQTQSSESRQFSGAPPPGFRAKPPFPRTKPPPGFLAS